MAIDDPIYQAIRDLHALFDALNSRGVIIGGVAVSLLARERFTKDLDAMMLFDTADAERLLDVAVQHGFDPRFRDMAELARTARMVTFNHRVTGTPVDIALGAMPFEEEVTSRAIELSAEGLMVRLPTPEDLIILKGIAHRSVDMQDIQTMAEVYPNLDRGRVEFWLTQYADLLDSPDIWDDVDRLLKRVLPAD